ncbi:DNA-directed DNA polymerase II small subunit [Candidatus Woesearchaeota archaeon]|nr:DNA-directed DNA polymerase II small subunit [Candidatus Woesearchaeota archaeon]
MGHDNEGFNALTAEERTKRKTKIEELLKSNILVSPEFLADIDREGGAERLKNFPRGSSGQFLIVNKDIDELVKNKELNVNWLELERYKAISEKKQNPLPYSSFLGALSLQQQQPEPKKAGIVANPGTQLNFSLSSAGSVRIVSSYSTSPSKKEVTDFVSYYNARYKLVQGVLAKRAELSGLVQIGRLNGSNVSESAAIIGIVKDKQQTKQGHTVLTLEDHTGLINVIVNKTRREIFELAQDLVFDEVIAVTGNVRGGALFANNIVLPDIPLRELKHSPDEGYAVFMSDLHFGSAQFLEEEFRRFLKWINGNLGNPAQREIASKVKYVLIAGDVVDGVGVYQDQYDELALKDVKEQYRLCADFLSEIPQRIQIIISPGNHDATRAAEPQTALAEDFAAPLLKLPNVIPVSNPAVVNIDASGDFPGFDILVYHGYSFDYYVANVDSIRKQGGYDRADLVMKFLLQRRHLAPAHTSTLILPDQADDPLFIGVVPDIFLTGHVHRTSVSDYKGVVLVNSSCWQGKTKFQERMGHNPQPARLPVFNLKTRATKIINFGK